MDEQELKKLQRYIGKRDKGETTEEIITHIRKMMEGEAWKEETWNQLLIPTCSSGDVVLFRWLLEQGACLKTVMHELPGYVIYSQEKRLEYQKKRDLPYLWLIAIKIDYLNVVGMGQILYGKKQPLVAVVLLVVFWWML